MGRFASPWIGSTSVQGAPVHDGRAVGATGSLKARQRSSGPPSGHIDRGAKLLFGWGPAPSSGRFGLFLERYERFQVSALLLPACTPLPHMPRTRG